MPVLIGMKFDGGAKSFTVALEKELDHLKNFKGLWMKIIEYFEQEGSPIVEIFKSKGSVIGGNWSNSPEYDQWKAKHWDKMRTEDVPIPGMSEQVLTGKELNALLDGGKDTAIRITGDREMVYGLENEYTRQWQDERKILDFFPAMNEGLRRLLVDFVKEVKELEWQGNE